MVMSGTLVAFLCSTCGERGGDASEEMKESKRVPQVRD